MPRSRQVWKKLSILDNTSRMSASKPRMCSTLIKIDINKKLESLRPRVKLRPLNSDQLMNWPKTLSSKEWMRKLQWERQRLTNWQLRRIKRNRRLWIKNLSWERFRMPTYSISKPQERLKILYWLTLLTLVRGVCYLSSTVKKSQRPTKTPRKEILLMMLLPNVSSKMEDQRKLSWPRKPKSSQELSRREKLSLRWIKTPRSATSKPKN